MLLELPLTCTCEQKQGYFIIYSKTRLQTDSWNEKKERKKKPGNERYLAWNKNVTEFILVLEPNVNLKSVTS